jgi:HlyD family secretion protein
VIVKKLLVLLFVIGAGLAGLAFWLSSPRARSVSENTFTFAAVEKGDMLESISATGVVKIEPDHMVVVGSAMPGTVVAVLGKVNQVVSEGALLVKLDDRRLRLKVEEAVNGVHTARAALARAEAALEQARALQKAAELAVKYQKDLEGKSGFRSDRDQAEAKLKAARAGVSEAEAGIRMANAKLKAVEASAREAQLALEMAQVTVPLVHRPGLASAANLGEEQEAASGGHVYLIVESKVQLGQQVGPGSEPLFVLARNLEQMQVHAQVAEGDIGKVRKGLVASFTVTAFSDENVEFRGKVKEIRPMPDNIKGAIYYDTVIEVDNQKDRDTGEWRLRPGMTAAVDIIRREHKNVWKMPSAALNFQMEEAYQSEAAKERLAQWRQRPDAGDWRPVWTWHADKGQPWPIFVRVGGVDKKGEPGLKDSGFNQVLEWEPGQEPRAGTHLHVITNAPPAQNPGFFDRPANIKVS